MTCRSIRTYGHHQSFIHSDRALDLSYSSTREAQPSSSITRLRSSERGVIVSLKGSGSELSCRG